MRLRAVRAFGILMKTHEKQQKAAVSFVNDTPASIIEVEQLNKFYGTFHALKNINLSVTAGERVVICGPSGSGKSTLIRCFNGLESHNSGKLVVDGSEVFQGSKQLRALRQNVGMVRQMGLHKKQTILHGPAYWSSLSMRMNGKKSSMLNCVRDASSKKPSVCIAWTPSTFQSSSLFMVGWIQMI